MAYKIKSKKKEECWTGYSPYYMKTTFGKKWKKTKNIYGQIEYKKGEEILILDKIFKTVNVGMKECDEPEIYEQFKTYKEAKKFADKYMREN